MTGRRIAVAVFFAGFGALTGQAWAAACSPGPGCSQLIFDNQTGGAMSLSVDGEFRCKAQGHRKCSTFVTSPGRHTLKASGSQDASESLEFRAGVTKTWSVFER
jgi:hypothetical protein